MNSETTPPVAPTIPETPPEISRNQQIRLKTEDGKLRLILPPETESSENNPTPASNWSELWQQMKLRLNGNERFWQPNTEVHLIAGERLLDSRQLQAIAQSLTDAQLQLTRVHTSRRQTAVAAAGAGYCVEQQTTPPVLQPINQTQPRALADPLYLQTTVRSGVEIRHPGTVIVFGDVNPGGVVIADGDILIWGKLRGVAHAGAAGNSECLIMSLEMEPTQIRIADAVARAPENPPEQYYPEIAYVTPQGIRITPAAGFSRSQANAASD